MTNTTNPFFSPEAFQQTMQKMMDASQFSQSSSQSMEAWKQAGSIWSETWSKMAERQVQMAQSTMQGSIEAMRELSTCQGMEDFMNKQSVIARKNMDTVQANGQELASMVQQAQTKCNDVLSKQFTQAGK